MAGIGVYANRVLKKGRLLSRDRKRMFSDGLNVEKLLRELVDRGYLLQAGDKSVTELPELAICEGLFEYQNGCMKYRPGGEFEFESVNGKKAKLKSAGIGYVDVINDRMERKAHILVEEGDFTHYIKLSSVSTPGA